MHAQVHVQVQRSVKFILSCTQSLHQLQLHSIAQSRQLQHDRLAEACPTIIRLLCRPYNHIGAK